MQGGDPTGTGMGKLTSKKKITTNTKHVQTSHYISIDIINICLKKASMNVDIRHRMSQIQC